MLLISYDEACYKGNKVEEQKETETQIFQKPRFAALFVCPHL